MLVFSAMFAGQFYVAMTAAQEAVACTPRAMLRREVEYMEPYLSDVWHVLIRFGKWEDIVARPQDWDAAQFPVWTAWRCYARALAFSALGETAAAKEAQGGGMVGWRTRGIRVRE